MFRRRRASRSKPPTFRESTHRAPKRVSVCYPTRLCTKVQIPPTKSSAVVRVSLCNFVDRLLCRRDERSTKSHEPTRTRALSKNSSLDTVSSSVGFGPLVQSHPTRFPLTSLSEFPTTSASGLGRIACCHFPEHSFPF